MARLTEIHHQHHPHSPTLPCLLHQIHSRRARMAQMRLVGGVRWCLDGGGLERIRETGSRIGEGMVVVVFWRERV
jgi:hypothetical protein